MSELRNIAPRPDVHSVGPGSLDWQADAQCRPGFTEKPVWEQRRICRGCPVAHHCLSYATGDPTFGQAWHYGRHIVYGGFTVAELTDAARGADR